MDNDNYSSKKTFTADVQAKSPLPPIFNSLSIFILIICLFSSPSFAKDQIRAVEGIVVKVVDGDTVNVNTDETKLIIRLYGIDDPVN